VTLQIFDFIVSTALISGLFAAIYKVLPVKPITWRDVAIGALRRRSCSRAAST
jgi:membrane protein